MRYQEMPITPELDVLQQGGLVYYRIRGRPYPWCLDLDPKPPSYWDSVLRDAYRYAILLED